MTLFIIQKNKESNLLEEIMNATMIDRLKIGSVESKKELLFWIEALSFIFKWSLELKLVKSTGTDQRKKQTIVVRLLLLQNDIP